MLIQKAKIEDHQTTMVKTVTITETIEAEVEVDALSTKGEVVEETLIIAESHATGVIRTDTLLRTVQIVC